MQSQIAFLLLILLLGCSNSDTSSFSEKAKELCREEHCVAEIAEFENDFLLSPANIDLKAEDSDGNIASTNTLLVKFKSNTSVSEIKKALDEIDGKVSAFIPEVNIFELRFDCDSIDQIERNIQTLLSSGIVELAEMNYVAQLEDLDIGSNNDDGLWGFKKIRLAEAYNFIEQNSIVLQPIKIAVIDSGVRLTHSDLKGVSVEEYDLFDNDNDVTTLDGHGTAVAGIIFAQNHNGDLNGIAFNATLMAYKITNNSGSNEYFDRDSIVAIIHAVQHNASVINISSRTSSDSETVEALYSAIRFAYENGVTIVASAGNGEDELLCRVNQNLDICFIGDDATNHYPSAFSEVISVGATYIDEFGLENRAPWSNYSQDDDINILALSAPANNITVLTLTDFDHNKGTSFASPMVAGLAGLLISIRPELRPDEVRKIMYESAVEILVTYPDGVFHNWRRINVLEAVKKATHEMDLPNHGIGKDCFELSDCNFGLYCVSGICTEFCFEEKSRGLDSGFSCDNCNMFNECPNGTACIKIRDPHGPSIGRIPLKLCFISCKNDNDCYDGHICWLNINSSGGFCVPKHYEDLYNDGSTEGGICGDIFDGYLPIGCKEGVCSLHLDMIKIGYCRRDCTPNVSGHSSCYENEFCESNKYFDYNGIRKCGFCQARNSFLQVNENCISSTDCPLGTTCVTLSDRNDFRCKIPCDFNNPSCPEGYWCSEYLSDSNVCHELGLGACSL